MFLEIKEILFSDISKLNLSEAIIEINFFIQKFNAELNCADREKAMKFFCKR